MIGSTNSGNVCQVYNLGGGTSFDVSAIPGYKNFTKDNFVYVALGATSVAGEYGGYSDLWATTNPSYTYNAATGKVTLGGNANSWSANSNGYSSHAEISISGYTLLITGTIKKI